MNVQEMVEKEVAEEVAEEGVGEEIFLDPTSN